MRRPAHIWIEAQDAYREAIDVGRSDPNLYAADCALASNQLLLAWTNGESGDSEFQASRLRCVRGLEADPDHAGIWRPSAKLLWRRGEFLLDQGGAGREDDHPRVHRGGTEGMCLWTPTTPTV